MLAVETYEPFPDQAADFTWIVDTNGDGRTDRFVSAEWDGGLVADVDDAAETAIGTGAVSRPSPSALAVSFPVSLLGGATSYTYSVLAVTDLNGNGEADAGETDRAPDVGGWAHTLAPAGGAGAP